MIKPQYKIEAKSDGNWIIINDSVKNTYYLWDSQEVADGQYIIRISHERSDKKI